jgi:pyruvate dehydrogenase (quinone)
MEGNPRFEASQEIPNFPYAAYAESIGLKGVRVDNPDNIACAWDQALALRVPCVYEAITDPNVPPLPPHISLEQAKSFMSSIVHGDPERGGMIKQSMKAMAESMLPHPGRGG